MHQALLVPEVLLEIFAHVNKTSTQKSLAALAATCKVFYEPAMEMLWAKIDQLEPLLGCVTRLHPLIYRSGIRWDKLWAKDMEPLSAHEARQFLRHSARICTWSIISDYPSHFLSVILAEACVLPKLRSFTLSTKYLDLFLSHTPPQGRLQSVMARWTALEYLGIYPPDPGADYSTAEELSLLSDGICRCTRLVSLSCPMPDWAAWMHISYLPTLLRVEIDQRYSDHPLPLEQDIVSFSPFINITTLSLRLRSAPYIITVLQHSQFPSLKEFELEVNILCPEEADELFHTLSHCKACETLERITIYSFQDPFEDPDISVTAIPHLLRFTQLRNLRLIFFNACIYLDNDILLEAMSTWTHIHTLEIKDPCIHPSPVSFRGLFEALRQCPQLHTLRIPVETADIDIDPDAEPIPITSVQTLELGTSDLKIENPETLARIIFAWLPGVSQVDDADGTFIELNTHLASLTAAAPCVTRAS